MSTVSESSGKIKASGKSIVSERMAELVEAGDFDAFDGMGFCCECGAEAYGVEPDARQYPCDECGSCHVYGCEELLIMGYGA